jgi:hypothetical protein
MRLIEVNEFSNYVPKKKEITSSDDEVRRINRHPVIGMKGLRLQQEE